MLLFLIQITQVNDISSSLVNVNLSTSYWNISTLNLSKTAWNNVFIFTLTNMSLGNSSTLLDRTNTSLYNVSTLF